MNTMLYSGGSRYPVRCGVVLAAGDGRRVSSFIQRLRGDRLPKQYVNFIGNRSMLEHTFHRAEKLIQPECLFTVVAEKHLRYPEAVQQLAGRSEGTVVVQPQNKETAPGLLLPLMYLCRRYPDSVVAVFPSDHFVLEEAQFMDHVDFALRAVESNPSLMVLLGIEPCSADSEYGYIVPGEDLNGLGALPFRQVLRFVEKPKKESTLRLIQSGGLWNTLVIAFHSSALLSWVRRILPGLHWFFKRIQKAIGTPREQQVLKEVYDQMGRVNFSKDFLEILPGESPSSLAVLPVRGVHWSDWGSEERIIGTIQWMRLKGRQVRTDILPSIGTGQVAELYA